MSRIKFITDVILFLEENIQLEKTKKNKLAYEMVFQDEYVAARSTFLELLSRELTLSKARKVVVDIAKIEDNSLSVEEWNYYFRGLDVEVIDSRNEE